MEKVVRAALEEKIRKFVPVLYASLMGRTVILHSLHPRLEELAAAYNFFKKSGAEVTISSMKGGKVPIDEGSLQPPFKTSDCDTFLADSEAVKAMEESVIFSEVSVSDFDAVYLPGGHGVCYDMPENETLAKMLADAYNAGKVIGSVCHGPASFANVKINGGESLVKGKEVTGFSNSEEAAVGKVDVVPFLLEDKLKELGGIYKSGPDWGPYVVVDGNLVTGQNPASSLPVAMKMMASVQA